jgi:hypothetical protein
LTKSTLHFKVSSQHHRINQMVSKKEDGNDRTPASDFSRNQLVISIQNSIHSIQGIVCK